MPHPQYPHTQDIQLPKDVHPKENVGFDQLKPNLKNTNHLYIQRTIYIWHKQAY